MNKQVEISARHLIEHLTGCSPAGTLVIGVPTAGLVLASEVARGLGCDLDFCCVENFCIMPERDKEFGAVGHKDEHGPSGCQLWRTVLPASKTSGRTIVIVDAAMLTGATIDSVIETVAKWKPARIIVATPYATPAAIGRIGTKVEAIVSLRVSKDEREARDYCAKLATPNPVEVMAGLRGLAPPCTDKPGFFTSDI